MKSGAQRFVDRNGPTKDEIDEIEYRMITAEMAPDDDTDALTRESLPPRADEEDDIPF